MPLPPPTPTPTRGDSSPPATCRAGHQTYNCTSTRRLIPSCGVYDGLRQPLSLYYRSWPSNPSKDCQTPSKTTIRCLFLALHRLCLPIPALYRCEQQSLPLWGYYTDSGCRIPAQMYTIPSWLDGMARTDIVPSWAHSTSRKLRPERRRQASTRRLQEKIRLS